MFNFLFSLDKNVRKILCRFLISFFVLIISSTICFYDYYHNNMNLILLFFVIIAFASTMLLSRDASKTLRRGMPGNETARKIALVLAIPQIVLGVAFFVIGVVMPFVELYGAIKDIQSGHSSFFHFIYMINSFMALAIGYYIIYEGLGFGRHNEKRSSSEKQ